MTEQQRDRIKGLFFGQAIGDALGLGTEFLSKKQISEYYPGGFWDYDQIVRDAHRSRWQSGAWTDDTDQFLCICEAILGESGLSEYTFARALSQWFKSGAMGIGKTVYKVVTLPQFETYPHKAAHLVWKLSGYRMASNGAIMRTAILGAYEFWDFSKVVQNTETIARVTHSDPRCVGSCVVVNAIIANLLRSNRDSTVEELIKIADPYDDRIQSYIKMAALGSLPELGLDDPESIGYTLKAMSAGLWAYFQADTFESGVLAVIREGGDADTNAAIAGSLLGAKFGYRSIPDRFIQGLRERKRLEAICEDFLVFLTEKSPAVNTQHPQ